MEHKEIDIADTWLDAPRTQRVKLFEAGVNESSKGDYVFTKQSAEEVISLFEQFENDMPVDYDHATTSDKLRTSGKAPAAGWIKELEFDPKEGLFATIQWTPRAVPQVVGAELKYISPVVLQDENNVVHGMESVAVTNFPATFKAQKVAANMFKRTFSIELNKDNNMKQKLNLEEITDADISTPEIVDEIVDTISLIDQLAEVLGLDPIPENTDETLQAAIDALGTEEAPAEDAPEEESKLAASLRNSLNLRKNCSHKTILTKVDEAQGHIGYVQPSEHQELVDRLSVLEADKSQERADKMITQYLNGTNPGNKDQIVMLNVRDANQMKWARSKAVSNPEDLIECLKFSKGYGTSKSLMQPLTKSVSSKSGRQGVIDNVIDECRSRPEQVKTFGMKTIINGRLRKNNLKALSVDEVNKYEEII